MKPARFDYVRAGSLAEAHEVLAAQGDEARIIAGGQSLVPMLSMRVARPSVLVDIMHLPELAKIEADDKAIRIGAGVRQAELLSWPELAAKTAAARRRAALGRARADAQPRHRLRLDRACRSERGIAARPAGAEGRGAPVVGKGKAPCRRGGILHRHDVDRTRRRRDDRGRRDAGLRGRAKALPSANTAAATAISPSSPAPPWRVTTACASPSAASPTPSPRATCPI